MVPMGQGNAGIAGAARSGGDVWHHLKGQARCRQLLELLATTAKNEGIASLEAEHPHAAAGQVHQQGVDLALGYGVQIGRASCREREEGGWGGERLKG